MENPKFKYVNFQNFRKLILMYRESVFMKVVPLGKWCRTVYTKCYGATLKEEKHLLFQCRDLWVLGGSWYQDLGSRILVPNFSRQTCAHIFAACSLLFFFRSKDLPIYCAAKMYNLFAAKCTILGPRSWYQGLELRTEDQGPRTQRSWIEIWCIFESLAP